LKYLLDTFPSLSSNNADEAMVCKYVDPTYAVKAENRVKEHFQFADKNIIKYNNILTKNKCWGERQRNITITITNVSKQ